MERYRSQIDLVKLWHPDSRSGNVTFLAAGCYYTTLQGAHL